MFVTVRSEGCDYEVHIDGVRSGMTIVDLATAIAGTTEQTVVIDGRVVGMTMPLRETGLRNGSLLEICRIAPPQPSDSLVVPEPVRHVGTFNRPPRPISRRPATILEPPPQPQQPAKPMRFGWAALVVPVVLGLAMAVLVNPRMAIFAVFSPAMLLANWFEDRRRIRREMRETGSGYRDVVDRFAAEVAAAYRKETAARHLATKLPRELQSAAKHASPQLWERRPIHDDFLVVPIGTGCVPWDPKIEGELSAEGRAVLDRYHALHDVPVSVELGPGVVCGLAGRRPRLLAVARQILVQAAVNHGPADLAISVFTENPADWDWVKWLPHTLVDGSGRRRIAGTPEDVAQVVALLPAAEGKGELHHLCIVDLPDL